MTKSRIALAFAGLLGLAAGAAGYSQVSGHSPSTSLALAGPAFAAASSMGSSQGFRHGFGDVFEASLPSIVQVRVITRQDSSPDKDLLYDFLRKYLPDLKQPRKPGERPGQADPDEDVPLTPSALARGQKEAPKLELPRAGKSNPLSEGMGTAFFIDGEGHLLTNAHVVANAEKITIAFADKRVLSARVVGVDARTDIALLKVEGSSFRPLPIGSPAETRVGDPVLAIGSPFGFEFSASSGILSAKDRVLDQDDNYLPLLQTDAAINPGNSGGPLLNERGQVIGMNNQIYSRSGGSMGIGFAIPIDQALSIAKRLAVSGHIDHGRIGVIVNDLTPELAAAFGLPGKKGAIVVSVEDGSPSQSAGIQPADIVVGFNGAAVSSSDVVRMIAERDPGYAFNLNVIRAGKPITLAVVAGRAPGAQDKPAPAKPAPPKASEPFGLKARPLSPEESSRLGMPFGLVVLSASSSAELAGIQPEDVIISVNNVPMRSSQDLVRAAKSVIPGAPGALLIKRPDGGDLAYLALAP